MRGAAEGVREVGGTANASDRELAAPISAHTFDHSTTEKAATTTDEDEKHARFVEEYMARNELWRHTALDDPIRGHVDAYRSDGEPTLPDGWQYRPVPLVMPTGPVEGIQRKWANCHVVAGLNALGKKEPESLVDMVSQSGGKVVVRTHLGTYTMDATLPYTAEGEPAYAAAPDGSTLVAYIEKAGAAHFGSYRAVEYGNAADFLFWAVGDRYPIPNMVDVRDMSIDDLRGIIDSDLPTAVNIVPPERPKDIPPDLAEYGLVKTHVYVPDQLDDDGGVVLVNPWGKQHSTGMTLEILHRMNATLHWVSATPYQRSQPGPDGGS